MLKSSDIITAIISGAVGALVAVLVQRAFEKQERAARKISAL